MMRYAYVHKNLRQLSFEKKVILGSHALTLLACFFPWFGADPKYEPEFFFNAFSGPGFLIGYFIFTISLVIVLLFVDRLLEKEVIKLPFSENYLYFAAGAQQIILIILMWSVLLATGDNYSDHAIRFGIFVAFVSQVSGLVATFLNHQLDQQHQAKQFFQHPEPKSSHSTEEWTLLKRKNPTIKPKPIHF